jgi:spermidine synthase
LLIVSWLFLLAYTCSGFAGLIYQVCWTRVLTLYIGHTTAAASAVVAAFLGGLALGASAGGIVASRITARQAVVGYAGLEVAIAVIALLLPFEVRGLTPLLAWAYNEPAPLLFPSIRLLVCVLLVLLPATALGATFPLAIRWFATDSDNRARSSGALYALNSAGAALGAFAAGFVLIPWIGVSGTTYVGVGASLIAAGCVAIVASSRAMQPGAIHSNALSSGTPWRRRKGRGAPSSAPAASFTFREARWLAGLVLGISGFAALVHEIAWTRVLTMVLGPTIYAFSAALAAVIVGIALGSSAGTAIVARSRRPAMWLAALLAVAAGVGTWTSALAGGPIPRLVAEQVAAAPDLFNQLLFRGALLTTALVVPMAALLGAAFPLAMALVDDPSRSAAGQFGSIYAVNTVGSVVGSLAAGFVLVPALGLETTLRGVTLCLLVAAALVLGIAAISRRARIAGGLVCAGSLTLMMMSPPWDRELLASGAYIYAPFVPKGVNLEALLKAGTLLFYREGAAATVSVKRLTGTSTLAVDGKTDASNRGDMLTQKLVAHLPLLLHDAPRNVAVVGLGSGVTVGAALRHPIDRADVIEISPEVVAASALFATENRHALSDSRTRLIVGDGRSHLQLSRAKYDVIISEPSNPWIAGVAALFTREFFVAARERLAPGGFICQWANAYNISDRDLRSIVATFLSVFPHGTAWLVGADDVVLLASDVPIDERLQNFARNWSRAGVADDLATVAATEPFSLLSLFVGGPAELGDYARGADVLTDDRMRLEFSGPRELRGRTAGENGAMLRALRGAAAGPAIVRQALGDADAGRWTRRGAMMAARDAYGSAYEDYLRALELDPQDHAALDGLVRMAVLTRRGEDALGWLKTLTSEGESSTPMLIASAKLLASTGAQSDAIAAARRASERPDGASALEQLATLQADAGDRDALEATLARMRAALLNAPATAYFEGVAAFLRGDPSEARRHAERALAIDPTYAAAHDLSGAASIKLGQLDEAREAFHASLRVNAHDSSAYTNLGVLALTAGDRAAAADLFAEALWLEPDSRLAREGLARALE